MEKIGEGGGMSDVEQLQAFNAIRGYLSAGDQQDLAHKLNLDMAKLDNRLGDSRMKTNSVSLCIFSTHVNI